MSRKNTRRLDLRTWREKFKTKREKVLQEELEQIRERLKKYDQCASLQQHLQHYCELKGVECEKVGSWIRCKTANGKILTVYQNPLQQICSSVMEPIYGYVEDPHCRFCRIRYLTESVALHLYARLGEMIKELENKKQ